jgi:ABC-2 type transport system permease protein
MTDLRAIYVIARRELLERVKSKWFIAITLLGPIGMIAIIILPALLISNGQGTKVELVDQTGKLAQPLAAVLEQIHWKPEIIAATTPDAVEMGRIRSKQINGFLAIPADALDTGTIVYRGDNGASQLVQVILRESIRQVVQVERGKQAQIADATLLKLIAPTGFDAQQTDGKSTAAGAGSFWLGYAVAYILMLVIMVYAVGVMRSVVQEKTSRVMELMVATIKPRSLMTGKILGVGLAGIIQLAVWLTMAAVTLAYRNQILGLFGTSSSDEALPSLAFGDVAVALGFFFAGYFFYASMYAAVGAMVSSEQDTQQVQMPITVLLIVGFACMTVVSSDPRGTMATVVTLLPCWSPLLMPMRFLLGGAGVGEVVLSLVILIASTVLIARAAAKIYRVGVLMYGKRPGLGELWRWLRY